MEESVTHMTLSSLKSLRSQGLAARQNHQGQGGRRARRNLSLLNCHRGQRSRLASSTLRRSLRSPRRHPRQHSRNQPRPRVVLHSLLNWLHGRRNQNG